MTDQEVLELIGYLIGAFGLGYVMGLFIAAVKRSFDLL